MSDIIRFTGKAPERLIPDPDDPSHWSPAYRKFMADAFEFWKPKLTGVLPMGRLIVFGTTMETERPNTDFKQFFTGHEQQEDREG